MNAPGAGLRSAPGAIHYNAAMKRIVRSILVAAILVFTLGTTHAQTWVGLRSGYPLGVTLHVGSENAVAGLVDLRVSGRVETVNGNTRVGVGLDFLRGVSVMLPIELYVGGGPSILVGGGNAYLEVHGLVGAEYRFIDIDLTALGIFAELSLGAEIATGGGGSARLPAFGAALGFNWHF